MTAYGNGHPAASLRALAPPRAPGRPGPAPAEVADEESIRVLWREHKTALTRFALKLTLGDQQRAEDIVQETLLRAWRHPEVTTGDPKAIRPWLFTVTRHVAIDLWRARSRCEEVVDADPADRPDPAETIEQTLTTLAVRGALARLSTEHRQVIFGMYYQGQSVTELARDLDIPEGTVKSRAYYGLRHLKRALSPAPADRYDSTPAVTPSRTLHPALCQATA